MFGQVGALRCVLADEDPRPPLRGTPPHAKEEWKPLAVIYTQTYYQYTLDKVSAQITGLDTVCADFLSAHGAGLARLVPKHEARQLTDRISIDRRPHLELELLSIPGFTVLAEANVEAVSAWTSHAEAILRLPAFCEEYGVPTTDLTTGLLLYADETPTSPTPDFDW